MEKKIKLDPLQPRHLRFRSHYKIYLILMLFLSGLILSIWGHLLSQSSWSSLYKEFSYELWISCCYYLLFGGFYFFWLKHRLNHSVQVFSTHICLHHGKEKSELHFVDVESVGVVCWSLFYFKMKNGIKHYFNSSLERVDYVWEGIHEARPDLMSTTEYENFRTKLVQYDHHQKRKEWFFRHKLVDIVNWLLIPLSFLMIAYAVQSREVIINNQGLYFFRLFMYSLLILMITTFFFSLFLKKFVFDRKIMLQMGSQSDDKLRDIEFEGIILQRSKIMQMITTCFVFSLVIRTEVNMYSVTKLKDNLAAFNLKEGRTLLIDNRYNCLSCKYPLHDGDLVMFGRGTVGQIMAKEGDMVGQVSEDRQGRFIASTNVQAVPEGHVAVKLANEKNIMMVKLNDLIGKIQN